MTEQCSNCKFWAEEKQCRRYPPQLVPIGPFGPVDRISRWPETNEDRWCGEWQATYLDALIENWKQQRAMLADISGTEGK